MGKRHPVNFQLLDNLSSFSKDDWNKHTPENSPFLDYEFLIALENSGCVSPERGWQPRHLIQKDGDLVTAILPGYVKGHSYGEYIFDWAWADAYARFGQKYYPKYVCQTPFTPASADKFCGLLNFEAAFDFLRQKIKVPSYHFLFLEKEEVKEATQASLLARTSFQFYWHNRGYQSFSDFLAHLKSRKAKNIRKERKTVEDLGLEIKSIKGTELKHWVDQFYLLYLSTIEKKGAIDYLNLEFFREIFETMNDRLFLIAAIDQGQLMAASLFFHKGRKLFGRYWGSKEEYKQLHFELCFYRGIEFCLDHNLEIFEAGAQGPHKVDRGFLATEIYSSHYIENKKFSDAIKEFIQEEKHQVERICRENLYGNPFKNLTEADSQA